MAGKISRNEYRFGYYTSGGWNLFREAIKNERPEIQLLMLSLQPIS